MISVIVPVYKVEPYLRQCIDSILAQTYTDFELILVDDGSPDNCPAICDEYAAKDSRIRVIHQENGGISAARNTGLDIAKGEYIAFVDSDDVVCKTYLERLLQALLAEQADIAVCDMVAFADGEEPNAEGGRQDPAWSMTGREACLSIYRMDGRIPIMAWGKLYRTALFDGIRYPMGKIHEDDATTPKVLYCAEKVVLLSDRLYLYRQRAGSIMSSSFSVKRFDGVLAIESCMEFLREREEEELVQAAKRARQVTQAKLVVRAYHADKQDQIPQKYKISEWKALRILRRSVSDDLYTWFLSLNHPKLTTPHSYVRKLESILKLR